MNKVLEEKKLTKAEVVKKSGVEKSYVYYIFSGEKENPSRSKLIAVCMAMEMELEEVQKLLKSTGFSRLYPKILMDSIIIYGINNHMTVMEVNEYLYELGLDILE